MDSFAIHSHKGGVGKSTISVNIATLLAQAGKNVCLVDYDLAGPNLYTFFDVQPEYYLNDYFNEKSDLHSTLINISDKYNLTGDLYVGFTDPSSESINYMLNLDSNEAMKMLQYSFKLKKLISKDPYNIDYLILDTTPGLALTTVNSFILTDFIIFIIKFSNADIQGTIHLISGLMDSLNNRATIIANDIPRDKIKEKELTENLEKLIINSVSEKTGIKDLDFLGWLPHDNEIMEIEFQNAVDELKGLYKQRTIHALTKEDHPFVIQLKHIVSQIKSYGLEL